MKCVFFFLLAAMCSLPVLSSSSSEDVSMGSTRPPTEEDRYINFFGGEDENSYRMWPAMKKVYYEENNDTLLRLCADVHKQANKGNSSTARVTCAYIHPKILGFNKTMYYPTRVDVVTCEIEEKTETGKRITAFHMTEGRRPDCVYLLNPSNLAVMHYSLGDLICDLTIDDKSI